MFLNIQTLVDNFDLPVSLALARQNLRAEHYNSDDELISSYIRSIATIIENNFDFSLLPRTFQEQHSRFPPGRGAVYLRKRPIIEVTSVQYLDADGVLQTLPPSDYILTQKNDYNLLTPTPGHRWPCVLSLPDEGPPGVLITYNAGYDDCEKIPANIRHAILLYVAWLYERRENPPNTDRATDHLLATLYRYKKPF